MLAKPLQIWSAVALLAVSASAQFSSNDTACTRHYVVQGGDTCDIIGQKTLTSTYQIMSLNLPDAGPDCYTLEIGVQLCLGTYGNDCQMVHRATGSDDCSTIASQYGIDIPTLRRNNPSLNCGQVYDGLVLCVIPGTIRPPSDPALNVSYVAVDGNAGNAVTTMPLGEVIIATNAAQVPPSPTQAAPVQSPAPSSADPSKRHGHLEHLNGGHHHHVAKKHQVS